MRPSSLIVLLCITLSIIEVAHAQELPVPVFAPRPRLEYTAAELAAWRADSARQDELRRAVAGAEAALKDSVDIPDQNAQWIFYYACPKDASGLQPQAGDRHLCPVCKTSYDDERTRAAYRCRLHDQANARCHALALGYALTGEERFAVPVRAALLRLAALYPKWGKHDRWGRSGLLAPTGGWRYSQLLDEAYSLILLAKSYDLVAAAPCFSAEDRAVITDQLLAGVARRIMAYQSFVDPINNHRTWFNAAYAVAGVAAGKPELLRAAVEDKGGLLWQLQNSVTSDGLWYEGTLAYHFYALSAIEETVAAAARAGWDFSDNTKLRRLWTEPLQLAWPDGRFPVINDSDPASLAGFAGHYRWAAHFFRDPLFAAYADNSSPEQAAALPLQSRALEGSGIAILRSGAGEKQVCAMLDYGLHGGHHGHPDKLNLLLYAQGKEFLFDPGRITYSVPEYESWCRTSIAHNTVVINGRNQHPDTGRLLYFQSQPRYAACLAESTGAYSSWRLRRMLVLTPEYLVDVFTVRGKKEATLDWVIHGRGVLESPLTFTPAAQALGEKNGYQHLTNVMQAHSAQEMATALFRQGERVLPLLLLDTGGETLYRGEGIGYTLKERQPFLLRRKQAKDAVFIAVYAVGGDATLRAQIVLPSAQSPERPDEQRVSLHITGAFGTQALTLNLSDTIGERVLLKDH